MINYLTTNLLKSPAQTLVNTVNTVGVMGKGIALEFRKLYPDMYQQYRQLCQSGRFDIGNLYIYRTPNKIIVNFPTKRHWRNPSKIEYIEAGLQEFVKCYSDYGITSVAFPQLGCGNGGLDWEYQVKPMMAQYLKHLPIPVYIHLYPKSADFVPEHLDKEYAQQIKLPRAVIPFEQVWNDIQTLLKDHPPEAKFPQIIIDDERLAFQSPPCNHQTIYRQDIEDLWNTLRLSGTISIVQVPEPIRADHATTCLFQLLAQLPYIDIIDIYGPNQNQPSQGLQYKPPAKTSIIEPVEIAV